jgi:hypothetical protein
VGLVGYGVSNGVAYSAQAVAASGSIVTATNTLASCV